MNENAPPTGEAGGGADWNARRLASNESSIEFTNSAGWPVLSAYSTLRRWRFM